MIAVCLVVLGIAATSCVAGKKLSGQMVSRTQKVDYYNKVKSMSFVDVVFTQGKTPSARIEGDKSVVDCVEVKQVGDELVVGVKKGTSMNYNGDAKLKVYLTSPDLVAVTLFGSGDFDAKGSLDTDDLDIKVNGSGDAEFGKLVCDNFSCLMLGSGDVDVRQVDAKQSQLTVNGSGDVKMSLSNAESVDIKVNGSGDVRARCSRCSSIGCLVNGSGDVAMSLADCGDVSCTLNGSGDVELSGNARSLSKSVYGSGDVKKSGLKLEK